MLDLSPVVPFLKEWSPLLFALIGGPGEAIVVSLLCLAFGASPNNLVDAMIDAHNRGELGEKLKNIIVPH